MSTSRTTLFTATGPDSPAKAYAEISRLEAAYLKDRKRRLPVEILSISIWGTKPDLSCGVTAYVSETQQDILDYLQSIVSPSLVAA